MTIEIKVSIGELFDKFIILAIKAENITDEVKLKNVIKERDYLAEIIKPLQEIDGIHNLADSLVNVNEDLWDAEDKLRLYEAEKRFDEGFIAVARSIYKLNDERAAIKKKINELYGSEFIEEKSYN